MIGIIIQARMGSSRLPGKILKKIGDKTLLEHIFYRLSFLHHEAVTVLATTESDQDDVVAGFCQQHKISCFRGSEQHVLERYYVCAKQYQFQQIIRLTADNPFTDIEELDQLIDLHLTTQADYTNSFAVLPIGVGAEIFTYAALEKSYKLGQEPHHIEHVNEYILDNPQEFNIALLQVPVQKNRPDIRLTVDTMEDYDKACHIVQYRTQEYIKTEEAIELCLQYV